MGNVPRPGVYQLGGAIILLQALLAAGLDPAEPGGKIQLHRVHAPDSQTATFSIDALLSGTRVAVEAGDTIRVLLDSSAEK